MIDARLDEVLVGRLRAGEQVLGRAAAERPPVGAGEQQVDVRRDRRMQRHRAGRQNAAPRVVVGHGGDARDAEPLDEALVGAEEERAVACERPAGDGAELMAGEIRLGLARRIEEVARVERGVAMELERRAVQLRWCPSASPR